jgi:hypothetical protein
MFIKSLAGNWINLAFVKCICVEESACVESKRYMVKAVLDDGEADLRVFEQRESADRYVKRVVNESKWCDES